MRNSSNSGDGGIAGEVFGVGGAASSTSLRALQKSSSVNCPTGDDKAAGLMVSIAEEVVSAVAELASGVDFSIFK